jgi:hypothetical protein
MIRHVLELQQTTIQAEFGTIRTTTALFGLSRTEIFDLIKKGKIRSVHYKKKEGSPHGVRLIHLASVREYLHSLLPVEEAE